MTPTRETLYQVIADSLGLSVDSLSASTSSTTVPEWDSLRHLQVLLALEGAFGVRFRTKEMPELDSIQAIARRLDIPLT